MKLFPAKETEEPPGEVLEDDLEEPPGVARPAPLFPRISYRLNSPGFPVAEERYFFMRRYYPGVGPDLWNNWRWQYANRITKKTDLARLFSLSPEEEAAVDEAGKRLSLSITPYYASLLSLEDPDDPLRRSVIPTVNEFTGPANFGPDWNSDDPLGEHKDSVLPNLVHRYPDRVLFLATGVCSVNCRYCTRSRIVGKERSVSTGNLYREKAISYIREHTEIRDVLISGGDPLTLTDSILDSLLREIRSIEHVEIIRVGTKVPAVMPQRITRHLVNILKKYHPLYISIHATHPGETTEEMKEACRRLADAGIPLGSQTVLLKGINDSPEICGDLFKKLLTLRVRPYYLYQCDPVSGADHFRTSIEKGLEIIDSLQGYISGYAIPTFVVDAPGGGGKIPLYSNRVVRREGNMVVLKNYSGDEYYYPDGESRVSVLAGKV